jgi:hypothetical protein
MTDNRRQYERQSQRSIMRVAPADEPSREQIAILKDISRGGILIEIEKAINVGTIVTIELPKTRFGPPRRLSGRVMWWAPSSETQGWRQVGCRFGK